MDELSDRELITAYCKDNQEDYLEILINRYLSPVYNFIWRYSNHHLETDDIVQEAFIKAWKNLAKFDLDKSFKVWLFQIARNTCIDHLRKKKAFLFSELDKPDDNFSFADSIADTELSPADLAHNEQLASDLEALLGVLSPDARAVLLLYYQEGLNFREISEVLHCPIDTVKSRARRALLRLREIADKKKLEG